MPWAPRTKGGFTLWGCVYYQMNRNVSGPNGVPRHRYGSTRHPGGIFTPDADGASLSRTLQRRESQGLGYGRGGDGSQPAPHWASEMKGCRPRGIFHSVKSHAVTMGPGVGCSVVLSFFSKLLLRVVSCHYTVSLNTHKSPCSNIRLPLFPPPQRGSTTFLNGSAACAWKVNTVFWRRQQCSGRIDNLLSSQVLPFWSFAGRVDLVGQTHPTTKMTPLTLLFSQLLLYVTGAELPQRSQMWWGFFLSLLSLLNICIAPAFDNSLQKRWHLCSLFLSGSVMYKPLVSNSNHIVLKVLPFKR